MHPKHDPITDTELRIHASSEGVRKGLADILAALAPMGLAAEELGSVELVLAEALNNVVEHAYANRGDGVVIVAFGLRRDGVHFRIEDSGGPMPRDLPPLGTGPCTAVPVDDLPEGGFGWFLIRQIARDLQYMRRDGRNRLTFRVAVDTRGIGSARRLVDPPTPKMADQT